eukprot:CAMPEP_0176185758 /NCGR_PEP_ID=MMETSP0121_2-20121125/1520_1 /TAXON_ID=160619 /ORGANISM="Kryptoperidinium foliaceum, Strain CCMP 1326" /LENGTH=118 /DNA_ID=CAMNT_0017524223 /DNA_START=403 /DNA_END=756 /DNA_ORIENTATION=-
MALWRAMLRNTSLQSIGEAALKALNSAKRPRAPPRPSSPAPPALPRPKLPHDASQHRAQSLAPGGPARRGARLPRLPQLQPKRSCLEAAERRASRRLQGRARRGALADCHGHVLPGGR